MEIDLNGRWPIALLGLLFVLSGCTDGNDPNMLSKRYGLLLDSRPEPVTTIGVAKEKIEQTDQVIVEGWLDLKAFESQNGKALVMVREILDDQEHGGEGHDPSSCPFCKRRMDAAPKAAVVFVDEDEKTLPYSIGQLLPVEHGDIVVIQGTGKPSDDVIDLKIRATGVYLTKQDR